MKGELSEKEYSLKHGILNRDKKNEDRKKAFKFVKKDHQESDISSLVVTGDPLPVIIEEVSNEQGLLVVIEVICVS